MGKERVNIEKEQYAVLFQQGNEEALAYYYKLLHPALSLYAFHFLKDRAIAEEIASEAFVKTWRMHEKLATTDSIKAYLYKVVYNGCMEVLRTHKRNGVIQLNVNENDGVTESHFHAIVRSEMHHLLHEALKHLTPASRKVMLMYYFENKSTGEIARELKLHTSTIKTQKAAGLAVLRQLLSRSLLSLSYFIIKIFFPFL